MLDIDTTCYVAEIDQRTNEAKLIGGPVSVTEANEILEAFDDSNPDFFNLYAVIFNLRTGLDGVRNVAPLQEQEPCLN